MRNELKVRVGIITTLGEQLSDHQALDLSRDVKLDGFLDSLGFVFDNKARAAKPNVAIYQFAATQVGADI